MTGISRCAGAVSFGVAWNDWTRFCIGHRLCLPAWLCGYGRGRTVLKMLLAGSAAASLIADMPVG